MGQGSWAGGAPGGYQKKMAMRSQGLMHLFLMLRSTFCNKVFSSFHLVGWSGSAEPDPASVMERAVRCQPRRNFFPQAGRSRPVILCT